LTWFAEEFSFCKVQGVFTTHPDSRAVFSNFDLEITLEIFRAQRAAVSNVAKV
jgi:proteasome lid subunit RPN8/RPN11